MRYLRAMVRAQTSGFAGRGLQFTSVKQPAALETQLKRSYVVCARTLKRSGALRRIRYLV